MKKLTLSVLLTIAAIALNGCRKEIQNGHCEFYYIRPIFDDTLVMRAAWFADVHVNMFVKPVNYTLAFDYYILDITAPDSTVYRQQILNDLAIDAWFDVFVKRSWYQEDWLRQRTMSFTVYFRNKQVKFDYPLMDFGRLP
jgi:hypothetical protein